MQESNIRFPFQMGRPVSRKRPIRQFCGLYASDEKAVEGRWVHLSTFRSSKSKIEFRGAPLARVSAPRFASHGRRPALPVEPE